MSSDLDSWSILCVDDDPGLADMTATFLERFDDQFKTRSATSAELALEILQENGVDCIVSDYNMPGMDGLAFLQTIRATDPELPFILYTGQGSEKIASDAISAGVSDYMQKGTGEGHYSVLGHRVRNLISRHRARVEKHEVETRAETILESSPDAILVSVNNEFVYANPEALDLYGVSDSSTLLGRNVREFIHPDYRDDIDSELQSVQSGESPANHIPRTLLTLDDTKVTVEVTARHIQWDGEPGVVAIVRDLTERKAKTRERDRFRAAFQDAFDAMVVADDEGPLIEVNQSACDLFGVEKQALLGRSMSEFASEEYDFEAAWRQFEETNTERGTFRLVPDDGDERVVEYAATADIIEGEHLFVLRDVSERENRESVLTEMHDIISAREQSFDTQVRALLDIGRRELDLEYGTFSQIVGGKYIFEVVDGDDDSIQDGDVVPASETYCERAATMEQTLVLEDTVHDMPEYADRASVTERNVACYLGAPVYLDGDVYGTFCFYDTQSRQEQFSAWGVTLVDLMSRWVSYELQRQRNTTRLQAQNEKLEEFASMLTHDLRNPLGVAQGRLELAREECDSEHLDAVSRAQERIGVLIDDLLTLAREGEDVGEVESVNLGYIIHHSWQAVGTADATLATEIERTIQADSSRLQQLLENLMRNAVEHGGDDVSITIGVLPGGFYVEDDGPGIPEAEREEVFEAGHSTTHNGTGFGLAIAREIAEAHGWDVRATEGSKGGARFEITGTGFNTE